MRIYIVKQATIIHSSLLILFVFAFCTLYKGVGRRSAICLFGLFVSTAMLLFGLTFHDFIILVFRIIFVNDRAQKSVLKNKRETVNKLFQNNKISFCKHTKRRDN